MKYKYFYTDYTEGKSLPSTEAWEADKQQILHSMDCVLHMPNNFLGIINTKDECLQFYVNDDRSVSIDIPILENGIYLGSKSQDTSLERCLSLVESLIGESFIELLPDETFVRLDT